MSQPLICMHEVEKSYQSMQDPHKKIPILQGLNLTIQKGDFVGITGKSGEGKSTLLHIMSGLDTFDGGEVISFGKNLSHTTESERTLLRKKNIGLLFQHHGLLRDFTVIENLALATAICGTDWTASKKQAEMWLQRFDLLDRKHHYPFELSGGEKQRIALLRALITNPILLLADEPTGNLDPHNTELVLNTLQSVWETQKISIVLVTHEKSIQQICKKTYKLCERRLQML